MVPVTIYMSGTIFYAMGRIRMRHDQRLVYRVRLDDSDIIEIIVALKHYIRCEKAFKDAELSLIHI